MTNQDKDRETVSDCVDRIVDSNASSDVKLLARLYGKHYINEFLPLKEKQNETHDMVSAMVARDDEQSKFREKLEFAIFDPEHGLMKMNRDAHNALFDMDTGFVPMRMWWCKLARQSGSALGVASLLGGLLFTFGKMAGWW
jgi:hypothetical protein